MSVFDTAKKVPTTAAAKKGEKATIQMGTALSTYAALDTLAKMIEAQKEAIAADVKGEQASLFAEMGIEKGIQPESFTGQTAEASALMVFGKRSTRSPLSAEQIALLDDLKLSDCYTENVTKEDAFFINPALFANPAAVKKFSDALTKAGLSEIDGQPILLHQEKETTTVASEDAIAIIFQNAKQKGWKVSRVKELLDCVTQYTIKNSKMVNDTIDGVFEVLKKAGISLTPAPAAKASKSK